MPGARHVSLSFKTQQALRVYVVLSLLEAFSKEVEEGLWQTAVAAVTSGNFFSMPHFKVFFSTDQDPEKQAYLLVAGTKVHLVIFFFWYLIKGGGGVYFHTAAHGNKSYHFYQLVPGWGNIRDRPEGRAGGGGLYPPLFRKNKNKLDKNNGAKNSPPTKNLLRGP